MTAAPVRILLADDHEVVRRGVRAFLERHGYNVIGEARDGRETLEMVQALKPELVILDITMPLLNGIDVASRLRSAAPDVQVLILSMHNSEGTVHAALKAGAQGYVLKSDAATQLLAAVEAVSRHRPYFTRGVTPGLPGTPLVREDLRQPPERRGAPHDLTPREREIFQLLAEGKRNKEVAQILEVSVKTVETHRSNLMRKLGLHGLSDLIHYAVRNHLVEP
jgi:DNA-binding NarL/FixJ family response regulator